ncbi:NADH:ubiquinone oxidoreductase, NDUFS5-15kDa domain-containing protein [Ditylenchus destructor]|nr:NADH:ubiquinone oxidoreductase, NDUFS5-15kDa domain-containing protein [Ditylenchus destructor]
MGDSIIDTGRMTITPMYQIPIVDKIALPSSKQGTRCGFFETQFYHCMEAYGAKMGRLYCDLEHRDFKECITNDKQKMRMLAIRNERLKQYIRGERDEPFSRHVKPGDFRPYYFQHDYTHEATH